MEGFIRGHLLLRLEIGISCNPIRGFPASPFLPSQDSDTAYEKCHNLHIDFGSGSLEGPVGTDTVFMAGHEIKGQRFGLIVHENGAVFRTLKYGGILGLAFEDMSSPGLTGLMTKAIQNNVFGSHNLLAFYFTRNP